MSVENDRKRLLATDPVAIVIHNFVENEQEELEIVVPEPGAIIDGRVVKDIGLTPEKAHMRVYTITQRMHYLKDKVWVRKEGRSIWLHNSEESYLAGRQAAKERRYGKNY